MPSFAAPMRVARRRGHDQLRFTTRPRSRERARVGNGVRLTSVVSDEHHTHATLAHSSDQVENDRGLARAECRLAPSYSSSSSRVRGQSSLRSRESARSANSRPPVWQRAQ